MNKRAERWREHLAKLPMTNLRAYTTLALFVLTGSVYLGLAIARLILTATGALLGDEPLWEPSWEWLTCLAAFSGFDVAQFFAKRKTFNPDAETQQNGA